MNVGIKKLLLFLAIISVVLLILQLVLINHSQNLYNSYISVEKNNSNRINYIKDNLKLIDAREFDSLYNNLTSELKKEFGNKESLKEYIDNNILLSEKITNEYSVAINSVYELDKSTYVEYRVSIAPSDIDVAKEILGKSKVVRDIFIEVLEEGPQNYRINKIYEKEE